MQKHTAKLRAITLAIIFASNICTAQPSQPIGLINYGGSNQPWLVKLRALAQGKNVKFRILQLGDSHTASDYFTDTLRTELQASLGNGGIGWVYPAAVKGQRTAAISYQGTATSSNSRRGQGDFPIGGTTASLIGGQYQTLTPRHPRDNTASSITFTVRPTAAYNPLLVTDAAGYTYALKPDPANQNGWQYISFKATPPLTYRAQAGDHWSIGNISLENQRSGIILSALGINGAQLTELQKWRAGWQQDLYRSQADLVILSYGTNEAFNSPLPISTASYWQNTINQIRQTLPNAGILIIGAPESLKNTVGRCGTRAPALDAIQQIERQTAQRNHLLYWSWQTAMGGPCSMKSWINQGLGRKDGVHFTADGYQRAASNLANAFLDMARSRK